VGFSNTFLIHLGFRRGCSVVAAHESARARTDVATGYHVLNEICYFRNKKWNECYLLQPRLCAELYARLKDAMLQPATCISSMAGANAARCKQKAESRTMLPFGDHCEGSEHVGSPLFVEIRAWPHERGVALTPR
jgi:hypothetical protein